MKKPIKPSRRRLLCALLAALMACALLPAVPAEASAARAAFPDVPRGAWYAGYVYAMADRSIVTGNSDGTFAPDGPITRAGFLTILARFMHTERELDAYRPTGEFSDVKAGSWFAKYVSWGAAMGLIQGSSGRFNPNGNISRQEVAVLLMNFADKFPDKCFAEAVQPPCEFSDAGSIADWAAQSVRRCQQAGILDPMGTAFNPKMDATRAMTVKGLCILLGIAPVPYDQIPDPSDPSKSSYLEPVLFSKTVAGVKVTGVELDPSRGFETRVGLASDRLDRAEKAADIVARSGACVAVDGIFFESYQGGNNIWGSIISGGEVLRIYNTHSPKKPYFVVDQDGNASIEFMTIQQTLSVTVPEQGGDKTYSVANVGVNINVGEKDGSRMIYTRAYGDVVPGTVEKGLEVGADGVITKKYENAVNVPIPAEGYVLIQRLPRQWNDELFIRSSVGDRVARSIEYAGSGVQNISAAISCGPTLVKDGKAYGSTETYAEEGFTDTHVTVGASLRMAIGVKADGTVVIASASASLSTLSQVMVELGCRTAMNLDGGASTALYANGSWQISPGRNLSNMLVFIKKS